MHRDTFARRLEFIETHGFRVISLDAGLRQLADDRVERDTLVITIDDGWHGVVDHAAPVLASKGFPSTLYLTTYYSIHQAPVFRIAVQYLFWKSSEERCDLSGLGCELGPQTAVKGPDAEAALTALLEHGEARCDEQGRARLLSELSARLRVELDRRVERALGLVTPEEAASLMKLDMDIQLHTHRHQLPRDETVMRYELERNREVLTGVTPEERTHLCYPSGEWHPDQLATLRALDIRSATTCDPGSNPGGADPLTLRRFLDGENITDLEFEAELCGFLDLGREVKSRLRLS